MHPWPPTCYQRAVAFVTDPNERLLVFDHVDVPAAGTQEQIGHAFHLTLEDLAGRERWEYDECDGGNVVKHRFALRWVSLDQAARELWPTQSMWLPSLRCSLDQLPT